MTMDVSRTETGEPVARVAKAEKFHMLGGSLELVASFEKPAGDAVLMRSRMSPGSVAPLHSHSDPESFLVLEGEIEAFADDGQGWRTVAAGESVSMENGIAHSLQAGPSGADVIVTVNSRLAAFFRDAQRCADQEGPTGPPTAEDVAHVAQVAKEYGYWMASPQQQAEATGRPLGH